MRDKGPGMYNEAEETITKLESECTKNAFNNEKSNMGTVEVIILYLNR